MSNQRTHKDTSSGVAAVSGGSPTFKYFFQGITTLMLVCLAIDVALVVLIDVPTEQQENLMSALADAWKGSMGALLGMVGGKAL